ncbi:unnamed protein product [Clavelina lepadiformis]|uniref:Uncharacterized protein n=1 Tax=Clavelina lepadiformis TaxID=159417 RepID=A0ABP0FV03_CLALP
MMDERMYEEMYVQDIPLQDKRLTRSPAITLIRSHNRKVFAAKKYVGLHSNRVNIHENVSYIALDIIE